MPRRASASSGGQVGGELVGEIGAEHGAGVFDESAELGEGVQRAGGQELFFGGAGDGVPGADASGERDAFQCLHGRFADAARRRVDDAAERDRVVRVLHELEVAEDVLDLGAVVEARSRRPCGTGSGSGAAPLPPGATASWCGRARRSGACPRLVAGAARR